MIKDYFILAFKNLKHRGLRSWLTMLGIFIGIAAVVSLISLGAGLKDAVTGQFGSLSVDTLTIQNKGAGFGPPGSTVVEKLNDKDIEIIESVSGIKKVIPRLIRVVEVEYNGISKYLYISDVPEDRESIEVVYESLGFGAEVGKMIQEGDRSVVVIGKEVADSKNFDKEIRVGKKIDIEGTSLKVQGILEKTSSFTFNEIILIPTEDLQDILNINNEYDLLIAKVDDTSKIKQISEQLEKKFRRDRNEDVGEESFSVETPLQSLDSVNTILNIINAIVLGIAAISLFVGGVGITNTMYTSVLERTKEIGVMKAIGARNKDIFYVFLVESGLLGLVGGLVGATIGLLAALGIAKIANNFLGAGLFEISISYSLLLGAIMFSFFVGVLSGTLPAIQASRLNIVEAMRSK